MLIHALRILAKTAALASHYGVARRFSANAPRLGGIDSVVLLFLDGVGYCNQAKIKNFTEPNTQQLMGCYQYSLTLEDSSKYLKITDNQMTYSMCQNLLETQNINPPYTMFSQFLKKRSR